MTQSENSGAAILQTQAAGRGFIAFAALSGAISVIAGAFSAHGLDAVAEAKGMQLDLEPLSGEAVQAEVAKAYAMPARIVERARQSLIYRPQ